MLLLKHKNNRLNKITKRIISFGFILSTIYLLFQPTSFAISSDINITATTLPPSESFSINLKANKTELKTNETATITATITSNSTKSNNLRLEFLLEKAVLSENGNNNIDAIDYIDNSVVSDLAQTYTYYDLNNNKLIIELYNFPANSNHEISFKVKIKNNSLFDQFTAEANIKLSTIIKDTIISVKSLHLKILKNSSSTNSSLNNQKVTVKETKLTQTQKPNLMILEILTQKITNNSAILEILLSKPAKLKVAYDSNINKMENKIESLESLQKHIIKLTELTPNTSYYLKFEAISETEIAKSNIYFFTTASKQTKELDKQMAILMLDGIIEDTNNTQAIVPTNTLINIQIKDENRNIKTATIKLVPQQILGINTDEKEIPFTETNLKKINPNWLSGSLKTRNLGSYDLILEIKTFDNSYYNKNLKKIIITTPIRLLDENTKEPISNQIFEIYRYQHKFGIYENITDTLNIDTRTDSQGYFKHYLPLGKYKIVLINMYNNQDEHYFEIKEAKLPKLYISTNQNMFNKTTNLLDTTLFYLSKLNTIAKEFLQTNYAQKLVFLISIILLITIIIKDISFHLNTNVIGLLMLIIITVKNYIDWFIFNKKTLKLIVYNLINSQRLSKVKIFIIDKNNHIIKKLNSNILGEVNIDYKLVKKNLPVSVLAIKNGYLTTKINLVKTEEINETTIIRLQPLIKEINILKNLKYSLERFFINFIITIFFASISYIFLIQNGAEILNKNYNLFLIICLMTVWLINLLEEHYNKKII
ncbi:MAG: hypothetical protein KatS3mg090_0686 [Patescibacteria group bacterium]|nr:MAG: hypothetical protein KatS3mg090_0686 [Patescibacteria group bacterium]